MVYMRKTGASAKVIAIANQKGGVGKTATAHNLGIGLARKGMKVLVIDCDAQGNLTSCMGVDKPDELKDTLASIMKTLMEGRKVEPGYAIMEQKEKVCYVPSNIGLSSVEVALVNISRREYILKEYVSVVGQYFDIILLDTMLSLGMLTINALTAADSVIIPVQAQYLPLKGLEALISSILKVKRQLNPGLDFGGILLTMADTRTNFAKGVMSLVRKEYGPHIPVFKGYIPLSVRVAETAAEGKSIFEHDPKGRAAAAFSGLVDEVLADEW